MVSTPVTQSDEYAFLLKTNEELTLKVKQLEEEQIKPSINLNHSSKINQFAKTIDLRIKELENENRSLTMNRSQC